MTTAHRRPLTSVSSLCSYLRCSTRLLDRHAAEGRCQLLAGHDGAHAVMFTCDGRRTVRSWSSAAPDEWVDSTTAFQRPWAVGSPDPAWAQVTPSLDIEPGIRTG